MSSQINESQISNTIDGAAIRDLYQQLLDCWNRRDAGEMSVLFTEDATQIGFDGSQYNGQDEIKSEIGKIFADHQTGKMIGKIRETRQLTCDVAVLNAVASTVPPNQTDIKSETNMIQTVVATKKDGLWRIAIFQSTPAQFHGRPELSEALTEELRQLL